MKARNVFRLALCVMLLLLAAGSGLARGSEPGGSAEAAGAASSLAARAPWFIDTVESTGDVGQFASVTFDSHWALGQTWAIHHDATNQQLRLAWLFGEFGVGNCGDHNDWFCSTLDSAGDVGTHSSIANNPANPEHLGVAYHDRTNGALKYIDCDAFHVPWDAYTIDKGILPVSTTGLFTSIGFDSGGTPYIAGSVSLVQEIGKGLTVL
jgi:hypothetical protein